MGRGRGGSEWVAVYFLYSLNSNRSRQFRFPLGGVLAASINSRILVELITLLRWIIWWVVTVALADVGIGSNSTVPDEVCLGPE